MEMRSVRTRAPSLQENVIPMVRVKVKDESRDYGVMATTSWQQPL